MLGKPYSQGGRQGLTFLVNYEGLIAFTAFFHGSTRILSGIETLNVKWQRDKKRPHTQCYSSKQTTYSQKKAAIKL